MLVGNEEAARIAEDVAEALAVFAHGRRINHRHVFGGVAREESEVEIFIRRVEAVEHERFVDRLFEAVKNLMHALDLLVIGRDGSRKQAAQSELLAFLFRKSNTLVGKRAMENSRAGVLAALGHRDTSILSSDTVGQTQVVVNCRLKSAQAGIFSFVPVRKALLKEKAPPPERE